MRVTLILLLVFAAGCKTSRTEYQDVARFEPAQGLPEDSPEDANRGLSIEEVVAVAVVAAVVAGEVAVVAGEVGLVFGAFGG